MTGEIAGKRNFMARGDQRFSTEDLVASAVEALKVQGDARAITVLAAGESYLALWDSDYDIDRWRLFISLPVHLFYALSEADPMPPLGGRAMLGRRPKVTRDSNGYRL